MLDTIQPFDEREAGYIDELRSLNVADPFSRHSFEPGHITASGFVLSPDLSSLLLVWHRKIGAWLQPGGHIEPGDEDVLAAQRREIEEETGVTDLEWLGLFDVDVHRFPARGADPAHDHFDMRSAFVANAWATSGNEEVEGVRWFPLDDLPRDDPSITRPAAKLRALAGR